MLILLKTPLKVLNSCETDNIAPSQFGDMDHVKATLSLISLLVIAKVQVILRNQEIKDTRARKRSCEDVCFSNSTLANMNLLSL